MIRREQREYFGEQEVKGNPVRFGDGHAAVIGDETCNSHYPGFFEGQGMGRRGE
jgi:hypothetical protein